MMFIFIVFFMGGALIVSQESTISDLNERIQNCEQKKTIFVDVKNDIKPCATGTCKDIRLMPITD